MAMAKTTEAEIGGRILTLETGRVAKQADGSVLVRYGDSVVLATVVASKTAVEGQDFFPLTVDYRERAYAGGRIPRGFFKRGGPPGAEESLTPRLIDRPPRPLFSPGVPERDPAHRPRHLGRPGQRPRHPSHERGVGRRPGRRAALPGTLRRRPGRPGGRPAGGESHRLRAGPHDPRPGRRRHGGVG